ncbi:CBS domain-containing protein [Pseudonocardia sp. N23]|uniref:CBS domain-containing protein n=1 Tax=Pseudonocardia sp. N23 TaxID=1987376 RepID=UPI000BFD049F|nr:CBS domain-containing protein [Pseudonocardia sp. N23]
MTRNVVTLRADTPIRVAAAVLDSRGQGAAAVVDDAGAPVGVVPRSSLDLWCELPDGWQIELDPEAVIAAVMAHTTAVAAPDDDVDDVAAEMVTRGLAAMPVFVGSRAVGLVIRDDSRPLRSHRIT